jgi:hypothetical protein
MITEMQVLEKLKEIISTQVGASVPDEDEGALGEVTEKNIEIDFPDVDRMRANTMFFIQPDYENLEQLSMSSDLATMQITIFILCKGASNQQLVKRVFGYYSALYILLRNNPTLNGFIDYTRITDMDYYPAVTAASTITAIEAGIQLQWSKDF